MKTDDLRIVKIHPLLSPAILAEEVPLTDSTSAKVCEARRAIEAILDGKDARLLVVVGPCSIHDTRAALEYAAKLKPIADSLADALLIVMRVYFEKPRTVVGWKGLINDPDLDEIVPHQQRPAPRPAIARRYSSSWASPPARSFSIRRSANSTPT